MQLELWTERGSVEQGHRLRCLQGDPVTREVAAAVVAVADMVGIGIGTVVGAVVETAIGTAGTAEEGTAAEIADVEGAAADRREVAVTGEDSEVAGMVELAVAAADADDHQLRHHQDQTPETGHTHGTGTEPLPKPTKKNILSFNTVKQT